MDDVIGLLEDRLERQEEVVTEKEVKLSKAVDKYTAAVLDVAYHNYLGSLAPGDIDLAKERLKKVRKCQGALDEAREEVERLEAYIVHVQENDGHRKWIEDRLDYDSDEDSVFDNPSF